MPGRKIPLVTGQVYHVINRGAAAQPVFFGKRDHDRWLEATFYYRSANVPLRYSKFLIQSQQKRLEILDRLKREKDYLIDIIAYCLMPNHIHFLLKQLKKSGISAFMSNLANSYTRYFNTKNKRLGPLFQGKFKAVRIETDEQLVHVSRYIHLNPYSSFVVKKKDEIERYPYSSFSEYLNPESEGACNKDLVLGLFKNPEAYKQFVFDQADYQRKLENIKHLTLEA